MDDPGSAPRCFCSPAPLSSTKELAKIPISERQSYPSAAIRAIAAAFHSDEQEIVQQILRWMDGHLMSLEETDRWKKLDKPEERDLARHGLLRQNGSEDGNEVGFRRKQR